MVKLTADLIYMSSQYINACGDRELCLRGYRIPIIENLGATLDQFNTIDFSDNDIRKLDGFPYLKNLSVLLFNNNSIGTISDSLRTSIPNLEILMLTGNLISSCLQLNSLTGFKYLHNLSLLGNPVTKLSYYRFYVVYHIPQLKVLDFKKIKMKERLEAEKFFASKEGKEIRQNVHKSMKKEAKKQKYQKNKDFSSAEMSKIIAAIDKASTLDQIDQLQDLLLAGKLPPDNGNKIIKSDKAAETNDEENEDNESNEDRVSIASGDFSIANKMDQDVFEQNEMYCEDYAYADDAYQGEESYQEEGDYAHDADYSQDGDYDQHVGYSQDDHYHQHGNYSQDMDYAQGDGYQQQNDYRNHH